MAPLVPANHAHTKKYRVEGRQKVHFSRYSQSDCQHIHHNPNEPVFYVFAIEQPLRYQTQRGNQRVNQGGPIHSG